MPVYNYKCKGCEYEFTKIKMISERNEPTEENCPGCGISGTVYLKVGAPVIGYSIAPGLKTTDNFNDRLKEIKKRSGKDNTVGDAIR